MLKYVAQTRHIPAQKAPGHRVERPVFLSATVLSDVVLVFIAASAGFARGHNAQ
jgi:hypothetical protein